MSVELNDQQRQALRSAADYIEQHGLHKGWLFKGYDEFDSYSPIDRAAALRTAGETPKCCTLGALFMTTSLSGDDSAFRTLQRAIVEAAGLSHPWDIPDWNDAPNRRKAQVVRVLRKAAEL